MPPLQLAHAGHVTETIVAPVSITNQVGSYTGSISALATKDQIDTQNDSTKYVQFGTPPGSSYQGYLTYTLPPTVNAAQITTLTFIGNVRGPSASSDAFTWSIFNWTTNQYESLGNQNVCGGTTGTHPCSSTNGTLDSDNYARWKWLQRVALGRPLTQYLNSSGQIQVQLASQNASGYLNVDYAVMDVFTNDGVPGTLWIPPRKPTAGNTTSGQFDRCIAVCFDRWDQREHLRSSVHRRSLRDTPSHRHGLRGRGHRRRPAGINPFGIMAADFNRDGKIDLAVVNNNGAYGVQILFGNGDGSFQSPVYYPSGYNPRVGVVADLDSDGNLDLAIANCISNTVSVYQGDGSGNFAAPANYAAGICPQTLAGGDFDGDGNLDLVTANSGSNNVTVLKGSGNGTFPATASFAVGNNPLWVAVADLNADTAPDLVVTNTADNTVSVLLNTGTDFSISASGATPATVKRGQSSTATVSLALLTSYNSPVKLTCAVQPVQSAPTCSLNPDQVTFAGGTAAATLTLDTSTTTAWRANSPRFLYFPLVGFALVAAGFCSQRKRRQLTCWALY